MGGTARFAYIDSVRALAALLVVWQHTGEIAVQLAPAITNRWVGDILGAVDLGRLGVILFFAISGYVIPASLSPGDPGAGRTFLIRRFFRLFPAYWLSIPFGLAALWMLYGRSFPMADLPANLTMLPSVLGATEVIGLYWTLAYELAFYAACLLLWRLGLLSRPWVLLAAAYGLLAAGGVLLLAAIYTQRAGFGDWSLTCLFFGVMFTGAVWRKWRDGGMNAVETWAGAGVVLTWLVLLPAGCAGVLMVSGQPNPFFVTLAVGYAGGVGAFLLLTSVARIGWRPLAWVGLVSYSLYLFHPVVLYPLKRLVEVQAPGRLDAAGFMGVEIVLAVALAAAVFYAVERPAIELGRRLTRRPAKAPLDPAEEVI